MASHLLDLSFDYVLPAFDILPSSVNMLRYSGHTLTSLSLHEYIIDTISFSIKVTSYLFPAFVSKVI